MIDAEAVLAAVREHGPITKTVLAQVIYGLRGGSPRIEKLLGELQQQKRVKLSAGIPKNGKSRAWVYSVTP